MHLYTHSTSHQSHKAEILLEPKVILVKLGYHVSNLHYSSPHLKDVSEVLCRYDQRPCFLDVCGIVSD